MTQRYRSLLCAGTVTVMAAALVGCPDPNARSEAEASTELRSALASIDTAQQGFVPRERADSFYGEEGGESFATLSRQYRLENLADAAEKLQAVVEKGSPEAKVGAHRLIADIEAAQARNLTAEAMIDFAKLSNRSANMVTQALLISQAEARGEMFENDEEYLRQQLQSQKAEIRTKISALQEEIAAFKKAISDLEGRIAKLNEERDASTAKAEKQREAAFTQVGDKQYESSIAAIKNQRAADAAAAQAEELGVQLEVEQSRLAMAEKEVELLQSNSGQIDQEFASVKQREDQRITRLREAGEATGVNAATLQRMFSATAQEQGTLVDDRFEKSIELFQDAVKNLESAQEIVDSGRFSDATVRAVKMDLLGALVGLTRAQYQYALVTGGYGETLDTLVSFYNGAIGSKDNLDLYKSEAERMTSKQATLIQDIRGTIAKGTALASALLSSNLPDQSTAIVSEQSQRLNIYAGRLDPVTIGSDAEFPEEVYAKPEPIVEEPAEMPEGEAPAEGADGVFGETTEGEGEGEAATPATDGGSDMMGAPEPPAPPAPVAAPEGEDTGEMPVEEPAY